MMVAGHLPHRLLQNLNGGAVHRASGGSRWVHPWRLQGNASAPYLPASLCAADISSAAPLAYVRRAAGRLALDTLGARSDSSKRRPVVPYSAPPTERQRTPRREVSLTLLRYRLNLGNFAQESQRCQFTLAPTDQAASLQHPW